ncbi:DNA-binding MarR family transcriptional regulator [Paenibacillus shirakamiensis]|uniref:DNA-binding MarR family transcriptional regulator n=1 Tax=Paenibacillus shirakamiensis TaxID=1265935 RepID=A0ABS4JHM2_9BACL|nr:MarR family transcriptional regulator [Paenibacillus shirakamiensis]MBP2001193.1 DNA-binding MarR family transcriptional regulator [Paenibacillus shirakamiensis]
MSQEQSKVIIERYINASFQVTKKLNSEILDAFGADITLEQFQIMYSIRAKGTATSTELADEFCVGKSSITAMITRLVDRGLIERTRDLQDRRIVYLSLTDEGTIVFHNAYNQVQSVVSSYLVHFSQEEIDAFIVTFEKLARIVGDGGQEK